MTQTRRQFIRIVPALGAFAVPGVTFAQAGAQDPVWPDPPPPAGKPVDDSFPSLHPALMKEMVGVSHGNIARVKELVQQHPDIVKVSWDWGFGDAETALGAASHVGNRPIAELLLAGGAHPTLFSATMLGQLDVVKAFIAATPGLQRIRGPHGLSLMLHARLGGPPAEAVKKYLESLGDADVPYRDDPLTAEERASIEGRYVFGDRARDAFVVVSTKNQLSITRVGATQRNIYHQGQFAFHAAGAPAVKIRFEREAGKAVVLSVWDPDLVVRATRA